MSTIASARRDPAPKPGSTFISQIATVPSSPSTVHAGSFGVICKTTDAGATWKSLKYGGASVMILAVDPKNSSIVYAGSGGGNTADGFVLQQRRRRNLKSAPEA